MTLALLAQSLVGGQGVDPMIYGGLVVAMSLARPAGFVSLLGVRRAPQA